VCVSAPLSYITPEARFRTVSAPDREPGVAGKPASGPGRITLPGPAEERPVCLELACTSTFWT
jgi:hypothetical protein